MVLGGFRWFRGVSGSLQEPGLGGCRWFQVFFCGSRWFQVVLHGLSGFRDPAGTLVATKTSACGEHKGRGMRTIAHMPLLQRTCMHTIPN